MRRVVIALAVALPVVCVWTVVASAILLLGTGLFHHFRYPTWQWWLYLPYYDNPTVFHWLWISAVVPAVIMLTAGLLRLGRFYSVAKRRPLHGETHAASKTEMQDGGLKLRRKL